MAAPLRRLPAALLVAAATALVFGGLLGGVQATGDGSGNGADELRLATPRVGDAWTYQAIVQGDWHFGENDEERAGAPFPYAEFEWLTPILVRDAAGAEVAADLLSVKKLDYFDDPDAADFYDGHLWWADEDRYLFRVGAAEGFAHESRILSESSGSYSATTAGIQMDGGDVVEGWSRSFAPSVNGPCLARHPLQTASLPLDETLYVPQDCLVRWGPNPWDVAAEAGFDGAAWERDNGFRFAARETVAGHSTYRYDTRAGESLWLSNDLPVPVQWSGGLGGETGRSIVVTLSSFTQGSTPLGHVGPATGASVAPPVAMAPRKPWGPDDSGVAHPFPASAAWQAVLDDPSRSRASQWLAMHPDASAYLLEYTEHLDRVPQSRTWLFAVTDQGETTTFSVTQQDMAGVGLPAPPIVQDWQQLDFWFGALRPDEESLPDELPTVASTLARWQAYEVFEGRDPTPNGWSMGLICILDCQYGAFGTVAAGRDPVAYLHFDASAFTLGVYPSDVLGRTFTGSQLDVDPWTGDSDALVRWTGYDDGLNLVPLAGGPAAETTPEPESRSLVVLGSFFPTPKEGVAISLVSVLAGLLYWLWPSLKTGSFLGLFSRVQGPRLLAHPTRARLHEIVQAEPGIHFQDLARKAGLANGTATHHLRKLDEAGLVAARPLGRYTCYFPGSAVDQRSLQQAPVLRSVGAKRVFEAIHGSPGLSGAEVASRIGLQSSTVNYHVQRLVEVGLVSAVRDGRLVRLRAVDSPVAAGFVGA